MVRVRANHDVDQVGEGELDRSEDRAGARWGGAHAWLGVGLGLWVGVGLGLGMEVGSGLGLESVLGVVVGIGLEGGARDRVWGLGLVGVAVPWPLAR